MAKKAKKSFQAYVRLNALVAFTVHAENPEEALKIAREDVNEIGFISDGIEYLDGTETLTGVIEND